VAAIVGVISDTLYQRQSVMKHIACRCAYVLMNARIVQCRVNICGHIEAAEICADVLDDLQAWSMRLSVPHSKPAARLTWINLSLKKHETNVRINANHANCSWRYPPLRYYE
jgi:hypothetical protein